MRRLSFLDILLILLALLVALSAFTVVVALTYPQATQRMLAEMRREVASLLGPRAVREITYVAVKTGDRAKEGYDYRIRPIFQGAKDAALGFHNFIYATPVKAFKSEWRRRAEESTFQKCTQCHKDLFQRKAFYSIYIDHQKHKAKGITCRTCHPRIAHPKPPRAKEEVCLKCHDGKQASRSCDTCHPPGSVFHARIIGEERITSFFQDLTEEQVLPRHFHPADPEACKSCHDREFCERCHHIEHPSDWISIHGGKLLRHEFAFRSCWSCHSSQWCGDSCHRNPGKQRISPKYPVPVKEIQ